MPCCLLALCVIGVSFPCRSRQADWLPPRGQQCRLAKRQDGKPARESTQAAALLPRAPLPAHSFLSAALSLARCFARSSRPALHLVLLSIVVHMLPLVRRRGAAVAQSRSRWVVWTSGKGKPCLAFSSLPPSLIAWGTILSPLLS